MGLGTSHDCWSGSYSGFNNFRRGLSLVAGMGVLDEYPGYSRVTTKTWPDAAREPLVHLLNHSDCDGEIAADVTGALADRLEQLLPVIATSPIDLPGQPWLLESTQHFIAGLREAHAAGEAVEFH